MKGHIMNTYSGSHILRTAVTAIAVAVAAPGTALLLSSCSGQQGPGGGFTMPPMPVETAQAKIQKVTDRFEAVGTVEALEAITVVSEIDGAVVKIPFEEGTFIKRGTPIALLDDSQLAAEVARARALHEQSRVVYNRVKAVVELNAGAPQDLDDAAAGLKVADANLALARARFTKTRVTAPFGGIVGARKVSIGTFLRTGQAITELANIDEIRVNFSAPERFLGQLTRGASVHVSAPAFPGHTLTGKIIAIEPILDPGTRSARITAQVSNPGRKLRPGMSADVTAVLSERDQAVTIPSEAIFATGDQSFVYMVKPDSTASRVPVRLGTRLPDVVEVLEGLAAGSNVVKAGHQKLFEGAKVMPVFASAENAPAR